MKIAFIVGHEKTKSGAHIGAPLNTSEYAYNYQIASLCYMFARDKKVDCQVILRDKIGIRGAAEKANKWIADDKCACIIELHCNSAENKSASGTETLFSLDHEKSIELARVIQQAVCSVFKREGKQNRGIKSLEDGDRGAVNLSFYKSASVIVEPAFGSNVGDCLLLWGNTTQYARVLVNTAIDFLKGIENGKN